LIWFAGAIELVGGILLLVGLFTRAAAFILSGEMAFAYFIGHSPKGFYPLTNGGEAAVLFCFVFLYIAAAGAGPWSIDAQRGRA
jgi:putative oxidoreductase